MAPSFIANYLRSVSASDFAVRFPADQSALGFENAKD